MWLDYMKKTDMPITILSDFMSGERISADERSNLKAMITDVEKNRDPQVENNTIDKIVDTLRLPPHDER